MRYRRRFYRPLCSVTMFPLTYGIISSASAAAYTTGAVTFDGTNDYTARGADHTGAVDSTEVTIAGWIKMNGGDGSIQTIFADANDRLRVYRNSTNVITMTATTSAGATVANISSSSSVVVASGWTHFAASYDSVTQTAQFYINGTSALTSTTTNTGTMDFTAADHYVGAGFGGAGGSKLNGDLADLFWDDGRLDLSTAITRFISGGKPVDPGADGSTAFGYQPMLFFKHTTGASAADFATNLGTGGDYAVTGTLTEASSSPSD